MKQLMITSALVFGLITFGYSQNRQQRSKTEGNRHERSIKTPEERAKLHTDALAKKLNLSEKQKEEIYALNLERAEKMSKIRSSEQAFRKEQMDKHRSLMADTDKKLNKILSKEQEKTYQEMKARQREIAKKHRSQNRRSRMR